MKFCEKCNKEIPEDYQNLLCDSCYRLAETGIADPDYQENEAVEELDLVSRCHGRFKGQGFVMPTKQREMYEGIRDFLRNEFVLKNAQYPKFIWKPTVIDIGCGLGIGTNILSHEADYVLGIDKNEESINYASQMFARHKNNTYWSPQVDFLVSDVVSEEREFMKFDVGVCLEVFEHLQDTKPLISFMQKLIKPGGFLYISSPNRDAWKGQDRAKKPLNEHHVRELTLNEFKNFLLNFFKDVEILNSKLEPAGEEETPVLARIRV